MTIAVVKNMGASVRQRLLNHGKTTGKPFSEVLQYYAMERCPAADGMAGPNLAPDDGH